MLAQSGFTAKSLKHSQDKIFVSETRALSTLRNLFSLQELLNLPKRLSRLTYVQMKAILTASPHVSVRIYLVKPESKHPERRTPPVASDLRIAP